MKLLIIGGTGLISSAVVSEAISQGHDVTCINRGNDHGNKTDKTVHTIHLDARNLEKAQKALKGLQFDVAIDFVCFTHQQTEASLNLLHNKCKQYVFVSTDSVYKLKKDGLYDETCELINPDWGYSILKAECEGIVKRFCSSRGLVYTIIRPSITYGNTRIPYGLMPPYGMHYTLIKRIKAGKPIITWNEGKNTQTMMRVEDFAVALIGLLGNKAAFNSEFNICGEAYSWGQVLDTIEDITGLSIVRQNIPVQDITNQIPELRGEFLVDRAQNHVVSNKKLKKAIPNFNLSYSLFDGIASTIDYYEHCQCSQRIDYKYDGRMDRLLSNNKNNFTQTGFVKYDKGAVLTKYLDYCAGRYETVYLVSLTFKMVNHIKQFFNLFNGFRIK